MKLAGKKVKLNLADVVKSPNIAVELPRAAQDDLGRMVVEGYNTDKATRAQWEQRVEKAVKLALQVQENKSSPWTNCSNVKFPLITIAALQFLARISLMTKGKKLAKVEHVGRDVSGKKALQASRISAHLSLQLREDDVRWADNDEQTKLATAIIGASFKKTIFDVVQGVNTSEHVPAMNFVVDYFCKDIDKANRATHLIPMNCNALQERVRRGLFLAMDSEASPETPETNLLQQSADLTEGLQRPQEDSIPTYDILEQHTWLDLDDDGYAEPYIAFVRRDTMQLLRLVARFTDAGDVHRVNDQRVRELEQQSWETEDMKEKSRLEKEMDRLQFAPDNHIVRIDPTLYFTRYLFIPSPDGGVYGLGLGALLGPTNEAVNTLFNQLIDSGTMANTAGGFLGRGVKLKGGKTTFDPFEWKPVESSGNDLRQNIFPLPVREPSNVLFQLLGMLITYGEKISGATDIMTGVSPGQNTPAETSRNTVEQGMMLFSGIYARTYRAFTEELRKFYMLNRYFLRSSPRYYDLVMGEDALLAKDDYSTNTFWIFPAASPEAVSQTQRRDKAKMLFDVSRTEQGFNRYLVTRNLLEAYEIEDIDQVYPDPQGPHAIAPVPNPKVALEEKKLRQEQQKHADEMQLSIAELKSTIEVNGAKILELQAKATKELAEANGVDTGHQIALIEAQIGAAKAHQEGLLGALGALNKAAEAHAKIQQSKQGAIEHEPNTSGTAGMGAKPSDAGVSPAAS